MKIEIVTAPNPGLMETGFGSVEACQNVLDSIAKSGFAVRLSICNSMEDLENVVSRTPDLVILAVKYIAIENDADIWLSDFFSKRSINFSGSSKSALDYDSNKVMAKRHLQKHGVRTADFFTAVPGQYRSAANLPIPFPLFLKPLGAANGNGIDELSFVSDFLEFNQKVASLYEIFQGPVLVEQYLDGREYTVAIIDSKSDGLLVSPVEIIPAKSLNGLRILGERAKKEDLEKLLRIEDPEQARKVSGVAVLAFRHLEVRDYGRIDIKTNRSGQVFFMKANLVPGMSSGSSYFPRACQIDSGIPYDKMIQIILKRCMVRTGKDSAIQDCRGVGWHR